MNRIGRLWCTRLRTLSLLGCMGLSVLAAQAQAPVTAGCLDPQQQDAVLAAVNAWRAQPRTCGGQWMPAGRPVQWSTQLALSAERFAQELSGREELSHVGAQGETLRERVRQAGYVMRRIGENLAAGPESLEELMQQWTASAKHCANLMQVEFEEIGLACAPSNGRYSHYWVLHLGARTGREDGSVARTHAAR